MSANKVKVGDRATVTYESREHPAKVYRVSATGRFIFVERTDPRRYGEDHYYFMFRRKGAGYVAVGPEDATVRLGE